MSDFIIHSFSKCVYFYIVAPTYQYSTDGGSTWTDGMPTNAGTYKIRAKVVANGDYESATSAPVIFIIDKKSITPQITAENKYYDGKVRRRLALHLMAW